MQLLELLEDWAADPKVVLVAAPSLGRILQSAPGLTIQALDKHDAVIILPHVIKKQQEVDQPKVACCMPCCCTQHITQHSDYVQYVT